MGADERARILTLLESGTISAEQAAVLLEAISSKASSGGKAGPAAGRPAVKVTPKPPAQLLRIAIDAHDEDDENVKVNVNVPLKLARFAAVFPASVVEGMLGAIGVLILVKALPLFTGLPDGPLVDIDATENDGAKKVKIRIEVV